MLPQRLRPKASCLLEGISPELGFLITSVPGRPFTHSICRTGMCNPLLRKREGVSEIPIARPQKQSYDSAEASSGMWAVWRGQRRRQAQWPCDLGQKKNVTLTWYHWLLKKEVCAFLDLVKLPHKPVFLNLCLILTTLGKQERFIFCFSFFCLSSQNGFFFFSVHSQLLSYLTAISQNTLYSLILGDCHLPFNISQKQLCST